MHTPKLTGQRQCRKIRLLEGQQLILEDREVGMLSVLCVDGGKEAGRLPWASQTFRYRVLYLVAINIFILPWGNLCSVEERGKGEWGWI